MNVDSHEHTNTFRVEQQGTVSNFFLVCDPDKVPRLNEKAAERGKGTQGLSVHGDALPLRARDTENGPNCKMQQETRETGKGVYQRVQNWGSSSDTIESPCDPRQIFHPNLRRFCSREG